MKHNFKVLALCLLLLNVSNTYGQAKNEIADSAYNGWLDAFLIKSGNETYFANSLENRDKAFFWGQAYLITTVEDAYDGYPTEERKQLITDLLDFLIVKDGTDWSWDTWNDDVQWAIIANARGYQITGDTKYLELARNNWHMVYNRGWDDMFDGGIWENMDNLPYGGKGCLSNYPQIISGCMIYKATQEEDILEKCKEIYTWAKQHLLLENGQLKEDWGMEGQNRSTDDNSYNGGLFVNAAASLYEITGKEEYLIDAIQVANHYVDKTKLQDNGIMTEHHGANGGFGCDQMVRGISKLAHENYLWNEYWQFLKNNCDAAWENRRTDWNFTFNDFSTKTSIDNYWAMEVQSSITIQMVTPVAQELPGSIEAEDYSFSQDIGLIDISGGKAVELDDNTDWVEYIVKVPSTGYYTLSYQAANALADTLVFQFNGEPADSVALASTGGSNSFAVTSSSVKLVAGIHSLKLHALQGNVAIDNIKVQSSPAITPKIIVNTNAAIETDTVSVDVNSQVTFSPEPITGSWSWQGSNGFSADMREISFDNVSLADGGIYTARYRSEQGLVSYHDFVLTINGCTPANIETNYRVNDEPWTENDSLLVTAGKGFSIDVELGDGKFSWSGPDNFSSLDKNIALYSVYHKQSGDYNLSYISTNGCKSSKKVNVRVKGQETCGSAITFYSTTDINNWNQSNYAIVNQGDFLRLGPHPMDNSSWSWTGPNGFSANTREVDINNISEDKTGIYTAKFTNSLGCSSTKDFVISLASCVKTPIVPTIKVNDADWADTNKISLSSGDKLQITLPVTNEEGQISWKADNGYPYDSASIFYARVKNWADGKYTATFVNQQGCVSTHQFEIDVTNDDYCNDPIIPYYTINNGASWSSGTQIELTAGQTIKFGPQASEGCTWNWQGPQDLWSNQREITIENVQPIHAGTYHLISTLNGCLSFADIVLDVSITNTIDNSLLDTPFVKSFPNPATHTLTLVNVPINSAVTILDMSGKTIQYTRHKTATGELNLNVSQLKKGMYFINIQGQTNSTLKFIKK
jgi:predicted alpha-1,6-mannanase (GH76 family)